MTSWWRVAIFSTTPWISLHAAALEGQGRHTVKCSQRGGLTACSSMYIIDGHKVAAVSNMWTPLVWMRGDETDFFSIYEHLNFFGLVCDTFSSDVVISKQNGSMWHKGGKDFHSSLCPLSTLCSPLFCIPPMPLWYCVPTTWRLRFSKLKTLTFRLLQIYCAKPFFFFFFFCYHLNCENFSLLAYLNE